MALTFSDLQAEVKRRAVRDQGGTQFDTAIKNLINTSLFRLCRESMWKPLRRKATFTTKAQYSTGTLTGTASSNSFTGSGITWLTEGVDIGRRLTVQGSGLLYTVTSITGENAFTTDLSYDGTTGSSKTYTLFGQEEYNLPIQTGRVAFLWHENFGYPFTLFYLPDQAFYDTGVSLATGNTPTHYRMWGEDAVIDQPRQAGVLRVSSSSSSDTSKDITVFGTVSGYPDYEVITTNASNGTTAVSGSKSFSKVERVTKDATTVGRITVDADTAVTTVAVLPVGDTMGSLIYKKIQVFPLPTSAFPVNVQYYKDVARLVNDDDVHELGQEFDEAIILLCVSKLKYENSQKEGKDWFSLYVDEMSTLKKVNADKLDHVPELARPRESRNRSMIFHPQLSYGQLGGSYGPISL